MAISLIVAMDENGVIGHNNSLPWKLPRDLQHVKELTEGSTIVLGRKNFESIGRALPDRRNIILTRNKEFIAKDCEIFYSKEEILQAIEDDQNVFIFGGEEIYKIFMEYVEVIYVTRILHSFEGDTYFPEVDWDQWYKVLEQKGITDEKNIYEHTFFIYEKKEVEG